MPAEDAERALIHDVVVYELPDLAAWLHEQAEGHRQEQANAEQGSEAARTALQGWVRDCRTPRVVPPVPATEEIAMSESTQDRPDEADEKAPKPGEPDTETEAGQPKKAPESEQQSKQNE